VSTKACGEIFNVLAKQTAVPGISAAEELKLYPNPVAGDITLAAPVGSIKGMADVIVMNAMGQQVLSAAVSFDAGGKAVVHTSSLPAGNYFLRVSGDGINLGVRAFTVAR
jgi:hypothetical protein